MNNMTTGQRIASRRKLANLSQEDISQELGVSRQAVSKWESDAGLPDIDNLITLSKMFGVSVGWLLGTEQDPSFDPSTGLSDAQLKMVEEIIVRHKPRSSRRWIAAAMVVCVLAMSVFGIFVQRRLDRLSEENAAAQNQITSLEQSNQTLISQMDDVNAALEQQAYENALILSCGVVGYLSEDGQTVTLDFTPWPKMVPENAKGYISIWNDETWYSEMVECRLSGITGVNYVCRVELPVSNGYHYSFILATESGYKEQILDDVGHVSYFTDLYDATRYHVDSSSPIRSVLHVNETQYSFTEPIDSPCVDLRAPYVGYEEVTVTLYHNGEPIHTESLREALREYAGPYMWFEEPFIPDIHADLPQLTVGDTLTLEITAKPYHSDVLLTNVLETLEVVE